jgi:hypothetical protein
MPETQVKFQPPFLLLAGGQTVERSMFFPLAAVRPALRFVT